MPLLMLTARTEEAQRHTRLKAGSDEHLAKPFRTRELVARSALV